MNGAKAVRVANAMTAARPGRARGALALVLGGVALLAACASDPARLATGSPREQALRQLGRPTATYPLPDGGERLQYSWQPAGDRVYNVDLGADGRVRGVTQAMDERAFAALDQGRWERADLLRAFGPPMEISRVMSFAGDIWTWRYSIGPFHRLLYAYVDGGGVVQRWHTGDDPAYEGADLIAR